MYRSPIDLIYEDMSAQMVNVAKKVDEDIWQAIVRYFPNIDKAELLRALQYDRDQYEKGYADGKRDAMESIVRCKNCIGWCPEEIAKRYGVDRYCTLTRIQTDAYDFCSYGERREGE